jgi:hypothetical protein
VPTVVFRIHPITEYIVDGEILGTAIETRAAVRRAIAAENLLVVAFEHREIIAAELASRRGQILVDVLKFVKGDHRARDVAIGERPSQSGL